MKCPSCGGEMKRNGRNSFGTQRWRCRSCGASATHTHDSTAKQLIAFLGWLLSGQLQKDMPGAGRTFRRRCALNTYYQANALRTGIGQPDDASKRCHGANTLFASAIEYPRGLEYYIENA